MAYSSTSAGGLPNCFDRVCLASMTVSDASALFFLDYSFWDNLWVWTVCHKSVLLFHSSTALQRTIALLAATKPLRIAFRKGASKSRHMSPLWCIASAFPMRLESTLQVHVVYWLVTAENRGYCGQCSLRSLLPVTWYRCNRLCQWYHRFPFCLVALVDYALVLGCMNGWTRRERWPPLINASTTSQDCQWAPLKSYKSWTTASAAITSLTSTTHGYEQCCSVDQTLLIGVNCEHVTGWTLIWPACVLVISV